jgi:hypothetical protein
LLAYAGIVASPLVPTHCLLRQQLSPGVPILRPREIGGSDTNHTAT